MCLANEFSGEQFASDFERTPANSGVLQRTFDVLRGNSGGVRGGVDFGEPLGESAWSSRKFSRIRASSRRTKVRRVYGTVN